MTPEEFDAMVLALPGVHAGTSYGQPAYKLAGKFFSRLRVEAEGAAVLRVGFLERDALMDTQPGTFFITPHYRNYPTVLVDLARIERDAMEALLWESWRQAAPKKLQKEVDAARPGGVS